MFDRCSIAPGRMSETLAKSPRCDDHRTDLVHVRHHDNEEDAVEVPTTMDPWRSCASTSKRMA